MDDLLGIPSAASLDGPFIRSSEWAWFALEQHLVVRCLVAAVTVCQQSCPENEMQIFYVVQHLIDQECLLITPVMHPFLNSVAHWLLGSFTPDSISVYGLYTSSWIDVGMVTTPFIWTWYMYIARAGAVMLETLSFGITLCQYTASIKVHHFQTAILFMLWWHLSAMPFPDGTYAYCNQKWTFHLSKNSLTSLILKAELSVRISSGRPCSKHIISN